MTRDRMNAQLLDLHRAGWRPVVHPKHVTIGEGEPDGTAWVAYPESSVREFFIGEGPDPASAVEALHAFAVGGRRRASTAPALTAEQALEARETRIREAVGMGWSPRA